MMLLLQPSGFGQTRRPPGKKAWALSAASLAAAAVLDVRSSVGRYEINPLLRNARGEFSLSRGIALKSCAIGGMLLSQFVVTRKMPDANLYRPLAVLNLGASGLLSVTALRNSRLD